MGREYDNWRPNGGEDYLLIYTADGSGRISSERGTIETVAGDVVLYTPGEPQDYRTAKDFWSLHWVHFQPRPSWPPWMQWPVVQGVRRIHLPEGEIRESFVAAFARMLALSRRTLARAKDLAQTALEEAILWANIAAAGDDPLDPRIRKALDYVSREFQRSFSLEEVARASGLSVSRLSHLFKEETGATVRGFVESLRLQHAEQLLRVTSLSVAEVAFACGFEDPFYFSNRFRRQTGVSPREYRS